MRLFRRASIPLQPTAPTYQAAPLDLNTAIETILVKSLDSQATLAGKIGELVTTQIGSLAQAQIDLAHKMRSRRGGKTRASTGARASNGRFSKGSKTDCRLCRNPFHPTPTVEEVRAHATHDAGPIAHESEIQRTAAGEEVIECDECLKGTPGHTHAIH